MPWIIDQQLLQNEKVAFFVLSCQNCMALPATVFHSLICYFFVIPPVCICRCNAVWKVTGQFWEYIKYLVSTWIWQDKQSVTAVEFEWPQCCFYIEQTLHHEVSLLLWLRSIVVFCSHVSICLYQIEMQFFINILKLNLFPNRQVWT